MQLSSLGLGTYLGNPDPTTDANYTSAATAFFKAGGNVFDTAANYRGGRSERALGAAFKGLNRDDFFVSTKAGYLPMGDGSTVESSRDWFQRVLLGPGILTPDDVMDGCHAMTPKYLAHQLDVSRASLGMETLDLFHLHNPEHQRPALGSAAFDEMIRLAFEACERFVQQGRIKAYGCATWNGFRVPPNADEHLSLENLVRIAKDVGGDHHHFRWIQAPLNLALPEAFLALTQAFGGQEMTLLQAAQAAGIQVQTSASIMQGKILRQIATQRDQLINLFPGCSTASQMALQFTRSCPGVTTALCGMSRIEHVAENAVVLDLPKVAQDILKDMVKT